HRKGARNPRTDDRRVRYRKWPAPKPAPQILTREPFHDQVGLPGARQTVRDVAHDGLIVEPRQDLPLPLEAPRVPLSAQKLERHVLAGCAIARAIDPSHPARSLFGQDLEAVRNDRPLPHNIMVPRFCLGLARKRTATGWRRCSTYPATATPAPTGSQRPRQTRLRPARLAV